MARVQDVRDLLFPVGKHPIFATIRTAAGESRIPLGDKKALINSATLRVLGVVSRDYPVVTNHQALDRAKQCCTTAFPQTSEADWHVNAVDALSIRTYWQGAPAPAR